MSKNVNRRDILKGSVAMSLGMMAGKKVKSAVDEDPFPPLKIVKKTPKTYSPLAYLERVAEERKPRFAFTASTSNEADVWQKKLRVKLWELIGEEYSPGSSTPSGKLLETTKRDGFTQEKWEIDIVPGRSMPVYVLIPESGSKPYRTALCLHGHGNGAKDIINMPDNDETAELIRILNTDYAYQTVKRGWCAVAPDLFAFGERVDLVEGARPGFDGGCEKPFLNAVQVGKTLIGIRARDICSLIDWLSSESRFDITGLPCMGLSGGGMMTMYTSALDDRIGRVLIAGYITEAKDSILGIRHCSCNYIPHFSEWADFPDVAGLIAPRFLIVQSGKRDGIFPIDSARRAYSKIEKIYSVFGKSGNVRMDEHNGFHSFYSQSLDDLLA